MSRPSSTKARRHVAGIALLLVVVVMWVTSSFIISALFGSSQDPSKTYFKPFLITYINTGTFAFFLIPFAFRRWRERRAAKKAGAAQPGVVFWAQTPSPARSIHTGDLEAWDAEQEERRRRKTQRALEGAAADLDVQSRTPLLSRTSSPEPGPLHRSNSYQSSLTSKAPTTSDKLTIKETIRLAFTFSLLWFFANYFGNASLAYTTVSSFTIISSMSGFFTLAFGALLGVETFTWLKFTALCASIFGVILVAVSDSSSSSVSNPVPSKGGIVIWGDCLALAGAGLYGCYTVLLKLRINSESRISMSLFFGFVGLFSLSLLGPLLPLLSYLSIETFSLPPSRTIAAVVAVNAGIAFVSDYLWAWSTLLTTPLTATVGISLTIPLALGGEVWRGREVGGGYWVGAGLVFGGFVLMNWETTREDGEVEVGGGEV
ncbi:hypothetical protein SAICODRAFT_17875 [Saitoella complicata NRRL Y-17804]|uniref:EamA domain-containing protein n=1 Tax=Saitoella complicata (strain BCRC 22490 / CBS 7301 / JCM 7358 / NBRC 10748 / NRRL Y-17804) TaxID=698492 RepID=A0A0E9N7J3_SAICN|nr:uncharacterized protein SAICODRAFT_17875 [Saitoella complicata NRRL Y-17804]ODQ54315.1 hypothetical protein SAICODRAFT_17875 [Saitoella complicata NRRL Y-17804]GAO45778.1 hypothetical protein G7K_0029-t1 [Saitoella complicata NRRL Y-17804]